VIDTNHKGTCHHCYPFTDCCWTIIW